MRLSQGLMGFPEKTTLSSSEPPFPFSLRSLNTRKKISLETLFDRLDSWTKILLLYLLVSTRAVIGQFSRPYSPVRRAQI